MCFGELVFAYQVILGIWTHVYVCMLVVVPVSFRVKNVTFL